MLLHQYSKTKDRTQVFGACLMKYQYCKALRALQSVFMWQDYVTITFLTCPLLCVHEYLNTKAQRSNDVRATRIDSEGQL